jgi:hypothetical protein
LVSSIKAHNLGVLRYVFGRIELHYLGMLRHKIWDYFGTSFWSSMAHDFGVLSHIIWDY